MSNLICRVGHGTTYKHKVGWDTVHHTNTWQGGTRGAVDYGGCDYGECDYGGCDYGECDYGECEYGECDYGGCVSVRVWPMG